MGKGSDLKLPSSISLHLVWVVLSQHCHECTRGGDELVDLLWCTFTFAKYVIPVNAFELIIEINRIVL
jgi:hypothetical protein